MEKEQRVTRLVYTSVDDCRSSLSHQSDKAVLEAALELSEELGFKSKAKLIKTRLRQVQRKKEPTDYERIVEMFQAHGGVMRRRFNDGPCSVFECWDVYGLRIVVEYISDGSTVELYRLDRHSPLSVGVQASVDYYNWAFCSLAEEDTALADRAKAEPEGESGD